MKKYNIEIDGDTPIVYNRLNMELRQIVKGLKKDQLEQNEYDNWMMKAEIKNG